MSIEQEVESLKRQLKRTRQFMATALIAGVAVMCMGQAKEKEAIIESITTKSLFIVDDQGKPRISLVVSDKDAIVTIEDAEGKDALILHAGRNGETRVTLVDSKGGMKIAMASDADGTNSIRIADSERTPCIGLVVGSDNVAAIGVGKSNGKEGLMLQARKEFHGLIATDERGFRRLFAGMAGREPAFAIFDEKGNLIEKP